MAQMSMMRPGMRPSPRPGMPPAKKPFGKMMADGGGIGMPAAIGGAPEAPPAADPDMDGDMDMPTIKPEAVAFHDDPQSCGMCQYFGGGQCQVLRIEVPAEGGCNAFVAGGAEEQGEEMPMEDDQDMQGGQ